MTRRRRGQLILLAAAVVVTALVPMLLAYAQLGAHPGAADVTTERTTLTDAKRTLERSVGDATVALSNGTEAGRHDALATATDEHLAPALDSIESTGTARGVNVAIRRNATAARAWVTDSCPRGSARAFDDCVVTDGIVTQTRANSTALVAVAVDIHVQGPEGTATATFIVHGVRGAVADRPRRSA